MKVYISKEAGVGDYIQWASALQEWQLRNPGKPVTVAYKCDVGINVMQAPGIELNQVCCHPGPGYVDLIEEHLKEGRNKAVFEAIGIPWDEKRLWYHITDSEAKYSVRWWGQQKPGPRVVIQWHGASIEKRHGNLEQIALALAHLGCRVVVLDTKNESPHSLREHATIVTAGDIRLCFALIGGADLFIGFDSGPLYAALGMGINSIAVFPCNHPSELVTPITEPRLVALYARGNANIVPAGHILSYAADLLGIDKPHTDGWYHLREDGIWIYDAPIFHHCNHALHADWESAAFACLAEAPKDKLYLDVGANHGAHLLRMSALGYRCIGFECHHDTYRCLGHNLLINGFDSTSAIEIALSDKAGEAYFVESEEDSGGSCIHQTGTATVKTMPLDDIGLDGAVGMIKIDVEGHEAAVLRGARSLLLRDRPRLIIECHHQLEHVPDDVFEEVEDVLAECGYKYREIHGGLIPKIDAIPE